MKRLTLEHILLLVLLAISVSLVLNRSNPGTNVPSRDGGIYAYIGSEILRGKLPYVDAWESKPPGIFYLNALALSLGGRWSLWFFEFLFLCIAAWSGHWVMTRWWGSVPALFGTLSWLSGLIFLGFDGNYTEEYALPFSFLAFFLFSSSLGKNRTWLFDFLIGLTGGFSFLLRANNVGVQIAIVVVILLFGLWRREYRKTLTRLFLIGFGLALPFLVAALYFASRGALQPMLNAALVYNFSYTGEHANILFTLERAFLPLNVIVVIALIGYVTILFTETKNVANEPVLQWYALLLIAWPVEILLSSLSGRAYNHYFICWLPVLGMLCAFAFHFYARPIVRTLASRPLALSYLFLIIIVLIGSSSMLQTYVNAGKAWLSGDKLPEQIDPVALYVRQHTEPGDRVMAWGAEARINFLSGREAPSAFFLYPLFLPSPVTVPMADRFFEDIQLNPPTLIVDAYDSTGTNESFYSLDPDIRLQQERNAKPARVFSAHNLQDVIEFIERNYHHEITIDSIQIYRLNP